MRTRGGRGQVEGVWGKNMIKKKKKKKKRKKSDLVKSINPSPR